MIYKVIIFDNLCCLSSELQHFVHMYVETTMGKVKLQGDAALPGFKLFPYLAENQREIKNIMITYEILPHWVDAQVHLSYQRLFLNEAVIYIANTTCLNLQTNKEM